MVLNNQMSYPLDKLLDLAVPKHHLNEINELLRIFQFLSSAYVVSP